MYNIVVADDAVIAGGPAALSDGHRDAGGSGRIGGPGHRHVRLRAARPATRGTASSSPPPAGSTSRTRATPKTMRPLDAECAATPAAPVRAPISDTFSSPGEISASTLNTLHNLNFYLDTLRGIRDAIAFRRFERATASIRCRTRRADISPISPTISTCSSRVRSPISRLRSSATCSASSR